MTCLRAARFGAAGSFFAVCLSAVAFPALTAAQARETRMLITVIDQTNAVIPGATVTVLGTEPLTQKVEHSPVQTTANGLATVTGLTPGRYTARAEFQGFFPGVLKEVRVRQGDNRHIIVLLVENFAETVDVKQDAQAGAADRRSDAFGSVLTREQMDLLSDDPDEMQRQLMDMAGPGAVLRIDSFEGGRLPPKSQIKSVRVTRDQFAAESPNPGDTFVEIITAPGVGPIRGGLNANVRAGGLSARNPFAPSKGADQNQRFGVNLGGALKENKSSFSINFSHSLQYVAPTLTTVSRGGSTRSETLRLRTPAESYNVALFMDYALTRDQTLRFGYYDNDNVRRNTGIGDYDEPERAYTSKNGLRYSRIQHAGPIGRRIFINNRLFVGRFLNKLASAVEAPTIRGARRRDQRGGNSAAAASRLDSSMHPISITSGASFVAVRACCCSDCDRSRA